MRLEEKNGTRRTGKDRVQEIGENKRSPDMEKVNSQKEWQENSNQKNIFEVFIIHLSSNY